jgi:hypothetical protein
VAAASSAADWFESLTMRSRPKKEAKKTADLVEKLDGEAMALLAVPKEGLMLETRLAIFANVARWAGVRNKLGDNPAEEDLLGAYRRNIEAASAAVERAGSHGKLQSRGNNPASFSDPPHSGDTYNGGEQLEALKQRLPRSDDGHADGNSGRGRSENLAIAGASRFVRPGISGDDPIDFDEPHSDSDI